MDKGHVTTSDYAIFSTIVGHHLVRSNLRGIALVLLDFVVLSATVTVATQDVPTHSFRGQGIVMCLVRSIARVTVNMSAHDEFYIQHVIIILIMPSSQVICIYLWDEYMYTFEIIKINIYKKYIYIYSSFFISEVLVQW